MAAQAVTDTQTAQADRNVRLPLIGAHANKNERKRLSRAAEHSCVEKECLSERCEDEATF